MRRKVAAGVWVGVLLAWGAGAAWADGVVRDGIGAISTAAAAPTSPTSTTARC